MDERKPGKLRWLVWSGVLLVALLVLYVLSLGPAEWLRSRGLISDETGQLYTAPLWWIVDLFPWSTAEPVLLAIERYIDLFR